LRNAIRVGRFAKEKKRKENECHNRNENNDKQNENIRKIIKQSKLNYEDEIIFRLFCKAKNDD
jgi:hypothetical protein